MTACDRSSAGRFCVEVRRKARHQGACHRGAFGWKKQPAELVTVRHRCVTAGIQALERGKLQRPGLTTEPIDLLDMGAFKWKKQPAELVTACHRCVTACHRGAFGWKKPNRRDSRCPTARVTPVTQAIVIFQAGKRGRLRGFGQARPALRLRSKSEAGSGSVASVQSDSRGCCEIRRTL